MKRFLNLLRRDEQGATAVEYGLILALVFLAMVGAVQSFGNESTQLWNDITETSNTAIENARN